MNTSVVKIIEGVHHWNVGADKISDGANAVSWNDVCKVQLVDEAPISSAPSLALEKIPRFGFTDLEK